MNVIIFYRLQRVSGEDFRKAEEFVKVTKILYTSTLCVSAERSPTLGQILPILNKLQHHFTVNKEDSSFTKTIKDTLWNDLSKRYQDGNIRQFLEEGTALDPRFKSKVTNEVWTRLEEELMKRTSEQTPTEQIEQALEESNQDDSSDEDSASATTALKRPKLSALEELFAVEDMAVEARMQTTVSSTTERIQAEINKYRLLPSTLSSVSPVTWWWDMKDTLPMLSELASRYLCVQASSTPSERTFSTAGDIISQEWA
ncbi:E3 SUMO-protein ligase ZBED1 [Brienomyrus brachyistius]|uniref:E3 SUMO-protein ligase ZBED1 n=1 Tax=Brienomyrus brachyistius TaxID=42636 RepID=UPI0020B3C7F7|nr:E3 SUMO-protein ligase ZBED1 [Brienomyrus brachyistius]XP_048853065.1 E3 SUMO-protein ligase ZBED1 [Brienomyrus brachyistius]